MGERRPQYYHLDLGTLARSLKLSSIDIIKTSRMDIESHWFKSIGPADLYFWKSESKLIKHQLTLYDQVIEWNEFDGVKTGYFSEERDGDQSQIICFDESINLQIIEQAMAFLAQVRAIEPNLLEQIVQNYRFYNRWKSGEAFKPLHRFLKRFGKKS